MRYSIRNCTYNQVNATGAKNIVENSIMQMFFADLTEAQVSELADQGCVLVPVGSVSVLAHTPKTVPASPTFTTQDLAVIIGFDEVRSRINPPLYGEGFNIAVIGTGIRETHELIKGHIVYSKNFTSDAMDDAFDHETGICSMIVTLLPLAGVLNMKVLDSTGNGNEEQLVNAITECIRLRRENSPFAPSVINLSLGALDNGNPDSPMRVACRVALSEGIGVGAAAGNDGPNPGTTSSPACEQYVFAVGSAKFIPEQKSFVISEFSSRGPTAEGLIKPDAVSLGEDVIVASSASDTATVAKSGTSYATPFMTALGILYRESVSKRSTYMGGTFPGTLSYDVLPNAVSQAELIDKYLPNISLKPLDVAKGKDNDYGYGLVFAPLLADMITTAEGTSMLLSSIVPFMVMFPMMAMMTKVMGKPQSKSVRRNV